MVIGDPYKFSIIFDRVDKWNMSINDNNGYLNLSIDSEIFPKKLINTIVNTSLFDIKNSLNNIPVDTSIYNMNTSEAFKTLYNLVYPVEFENDNDYRYELSPMALTDENAFVFAVKGKGKVKIVASILEYDYENSRHIFNDKVIEVILEQDEIAEIVNNIDDIINGYIEPEEQFFEGCLEKVNTLIHLTVNGEEIITTVDHPFYVKNQGFIKAGELIVGDELLDVNGNVLLVENFAVELTDEPTTVYNFQVEDFHTYYVGKNGILVHNADYSTVVTPDMENKILEGERVGSSNRIKGGHSPKINDSNPKYSVEVQQTFPDGTKKIKFITEFPDGNVSKIKTSTIFPDNWSDAKIIDSIKQVGDGVPIGKRIADNSYLYRDIIDGVQIEVIKQGNNVIAGYPTGGGTTGLPTGFTSKQEETYVK